jgi:hypothetical protein
MANLEEENAGSIVIYFSDNWFIELGSYPTLPLSIAFCMDN